MGRKFEFSVDMHVHSMYSGESLSRPKDIVDAARDKGLDAICVTEHESLAASLPFEKLRAETGFVVFRGVEITTDSGHMLVYGVSDREWGDWGKGMRCHAQDLIDRVNSMGGAVIPAHPYVITNPAINPILPGSPIPEGAPNSCGPDIKVDERILGLRGLSAIEVCNGKQLNYPCVCEMLGSVAKGMGLPGTGGSDAHIASDVGRSYTAFSVPVYSNKDLVGAIRAGLLCPKNRAAEACPGTKIAHISDR